MMRFTTSAPWPALYRRRLAQATMPQARQLSTGNGAGGAKSTRQPCLFSARSLRLGGGLGRIRGCVLGEQSGERIGIAAGQLHHLLLVCIIFVVLGQKLGVVTGERLDGEAHLPLGQAEPAQERARQIQRGEKRLA